MNACILAPDGKEEDARLRQFTIRKDTRSFSDVTVHTISLMNLLRLAVGVEANSKPTQTSLTLPVFLRRWKCDWKPGYEARKYTIWA